MERTITAMQAVADLAIELAQQRGSTSVELGHLVASQLVSELGTPNQFWVKRALRDAGVRIDEVVLMLVGEPGPPANDRPTLSIAVRRAIGEAWIMMIKRRERDALILPSAVVIVCRET